MQESTTLAPGSVRRIHRFEVHLRSGEPDPAADALRGELATLGHAGATAATRRVFLVEAPLSDEAAKRAADELLADPINQTAVLGASPVAADGRVIEVHYQPGVMDPVAQSTREAIAEMFPEVPAEQIEVRTGFRYDIAGCDADERTLRELAARQLANTVIQEIHLSPLQPERFPLGSKYHLRVSEVPIRHLDDAGLTKMSREAHLFLSLDEMRAIRDHYRAANRDPRDIELETIAQTWSEHCVHKTLKSTVTYRPDPAAGPDHLRFAGRPGHTVNDDGTVTIDNLLKSTVAAATHELMTQERFRTWCVSVFKDNAGIVRFDDEHGVCIKVETHNHPSAIEPYGGAATGIGGCIRDVMGTGLAAKPIANTDVFAVAFPDTASLPKGVIHPKRVLQQVVAGVRDYGNRMGIPTINGAVWFHPDYLANPLVFAGCIGLIPLDKCFGKAKAGDRVIALGGRTGRDGIHGATFSSAELTDTHADEFAHAVQIGNAITQKRTLDVLLAARDQPQGPLFHAITDCGAGGFSSAVGEMAKDIGARIELDKAPLKYQGLSYTEIWISEAQERMVLAVPPENVAALKALCDAEDVEMCDLGQFGWMSHGPDASTPGNEPILVLTYHGNNVGQLSMHFLHDGIPTPTREATWSGATTRNGHAPRSNADMSTLGTSLASLLSHPNIASKHWIIRQYDHEVQGGSVVKPLTGPRQDGPSDASVLRPKLTSTRGIAVGCGLQTGLGEKTPGGDSYWMGLAAIDEAVRNVVCAGADPTDRGGIAILDNFCWPRCDDPRQLGSLVRAAEACYDGAMAYRTPFVSGKDSLSNQFTTEDGKLITIPPTLLITALGIVPDVARARTMDAKRPDSVLFIVGVTGSELGGSHWSSLAGAPNAAGLDARIPRVDLQRGPRTASAVASLIADGLVLSAHDCSDGGLLVAAAEMAFAGGIGLELDIDAVPTTRALDEITIAFAETPSRYLLEVSPDQVDAVVRRLRGVEGVAFGQVGRFKNHRSLKVRSARRGNVLDASLDALREAWLRPLDW